MRVELELRTVIKDALVWLENNSNVEMEVYNEKQNEVHKIAKPILKSPPVSVLWRLIMIILGGTWME